MNYQSIYSNIIDYMARDDVPMTLFDTWLRIVEKKLTSKLTAYSDYTVYEGTLTDNGIELPDDFKQGTVTKVGGVPVVLQYRTPQSFEEMRYNSGFFTIKNNRLLVSGNIGEVPAVIEYNRKVTPLTQDVPANNITKDFPDLYLYGVLAEAYIWAKDAPAAASYKTSFDEALTEANQTSVAKAMSGSQLVATSDINYIGGQ